MPRTTSWKRSSSVLPSSSPRSGSPTRHGKTITIHRTGRPQPNPLPIRRHPYRRSSPPRLHPRRRRGLPMIGRGPEAQGDSGPRSQIRAIRAKLPLSPPQFARRLHAEQVPHEEIIAAAPRAVRAAARTRARHRGRPSGRSPCCGLDQRRWRRLASCSRGRRWCLVRRPSGTVSRLGSWRGRRWCTRRTPGRPGRPSIVRSTRGCPSCCRDSRSRRRPPCRTQPRESWGEA